MHYKLATNFHQKASVIQCAEAIPYNCNWNAVECVDLSTAMGNPGYKGQMLPYCLKIWVYKLFRIYSVKIFAKIINRFPELSI